MVYDDADGDIGHDGLQFLRQLTGEGGFVVKVSFLHLYTPSTFEI